MDAIYSLVYISEAADDLSYTDIKEILESSRRNNARDEITGLLLYHDGHFMQILEGKESLVRATLNRILLDDRNYSLKILTQGSRAQRIFASWSMAFYDADISSNANIYADRLFQSPEKHPQKDILVLLEQLRDSVSELR